MVVNCYRLLLILVALVVMFIVFIVQVIIQVIIHTAPVLQKALRKVILWPIHQFSHSCFGFVKFCCDTDEKNKGE